MAVFKGRTHLIIGVGVAILLYNAFGFGGIIMAALGSLLPDIDHPDSMLGKKIPIARLFNMEHRGWTHSLLGLGIFSAILALFSIGSVPGMALGYMLHLFADSMTPTGVAWFYPLSKNKRHIIGIRTGSVLEEAFAWGFLFLIFFWLTWMR